MPFEFRNVGKRFGDTVALESVSARFEEGRVTSVVGPSGCGKTTLLNIASGLVAADSGEALGFGSSVIGRVFQEPRLLPWETLRDNLRFVKPDSVDAATYDGRVAHFLEKTGLADFADKRPRELSGGMRQRASLARAFSYSSDLLLMDEPFQSVDMRTRLGLFELFLDLVAAEPRTVILVTHDAREALYLSDRIVVLSERPARDLKSLEVATPRSRRSFASPEATSLENELYGLLFEGAHRAR